MSLSDAGPVPAPSLSTTPSSSTGQKQHCRSKRKKRLGVIIDHKASFKPKYAKQPYHHHNPDAAASPMIPRPCTECGKKFWSWKALFGHMRCHPERQWRGINPPPNLQRQPPPPAELLMTAEDHEIAAGLLLLANSEGPEEEARGGGPSSNTTTTTTRFECSSCKKVFSSRQALGGHRASHKNVKGCFANEEDDEIITSAAMMVLEGHKCGICLRVFSSGQALGGHMRCHWDKGDPEPNFFHHHHQGFGLDLNLPPHDSSSSSPFTLDLRLGL